ncbi:hypothetical protein D9611_007911 [Ephemerocybe angulata]|uniref:F-box domain-containing protein n=1 Tax=Ephemerocybe angulata TaxID=980116 RepID=A0A8H5CF37_9AGAR|nr:hypothetical protein D9611_007911 [Tulosesus angulatus]
MVVTRNRGKPSNMPETDLGKRDDNSVDEYEPESSDEEFGSNNKRKKGKAKAAPKAKRQKVKADSQSTTEPTQEPVTTPKAKKAGGSRRKKDLSKLPDKMPVDILFEVFGHLSPKDLLNLSRTNKMFEELISGTRATSIWMEARKPYRVPEPPQFYSEWQWARLLFETRCEHCNTKNVDHVDWFIRKRLCSNCRSEYLTGERDKKKFQVVFNGYEKDAFQYLPHTNSRPFSQHTRDPNYDTREMYWEPDVHVIVKEYRQLRAQATTPEGEGKFEAWKKQRLEYVKECMDHASDIRDICREWWKEHSKDMYDEYKEKKKRRFEGIVSRFLDLNEGYTRADLEMAARIHYGNALEGTDNITTRVWNTLRPKFEPDVKWAKAAREHKESAPAVGGNP